MDGAQFETFQTLGILADSKQTHSVSQCQCNVRLAFRKQHVSPFENAHSTEQVSSRFVDSSLVGLIFGGDWPSELTSYAVPFIVILHTTVGPFLDSRDGFVRWLLQWNPRSFRVKPGGRQHPRSHFRRGDS